MPDYSCSKIYKIISPNSEKVYIGSTIFSLHSRFIKHKYACKIGRRCSSKIIINSGDASIELIELFPCESRAELENREYEIINATLNCCNLKLVAGISKLSEDYFLKNIEKQKFQPTLRALRALRRDLSPFCDFQDLKYL